MSLNIIIDTFECQIPKFMRIFFSEMLSNICMKIELPHYGEEQLLKLNVCRAEEYKESVQYVHVL